MTNHNRGVPGLHKPQRISGFPSSCSVHFQNERFVAGQEHGLNLNQNTYEVDEVIPGLTELEICLKMPDITGFMNLDCFKWGENG